MPSPWPSAGIALYSACRPGAGTASGSQGRPGSTESLSGSRPIRVTITDGLGRGALVDGNCRRLGTRGPNPVWLRRSQIFRPAPDRVIFKAVSILPVSFRRGAHCG
jgi:hypothetical protein